MEGALMTTIKNKDFLDMIDNILPKNDRTKLIECYPKESDEERRERIKQDNANIQRVDNQVKR